MPSLVDYYKARNALKKYGIRSVASEYVSNEEQAVSFWKKNGRIVLKVLSDKALHKSKAGLVMLDLNNEGSVKSAFRGLSVKADRLKPYKIIAQQMVPGGMEIILGGNVDRQFGKMVLIGLGGVYVEAFRDFSLAMCPVGKKEALSMVGQLRSRSIIAPDKKSAEMIADLIVKVSKMFSGTEVTELDLNPIILHDGTYDAVDLRMLG